MRSGLILVLAVVVGTALNAAPAGAAPDDQGQRPPSRPTPDFLFGRPMGSIGVRAGMLFERASSDWYDFVTGPNQLTINRSDFNAPGIASDVAIAIGRRLDVVGGVDFAQTSIESEYRTLVDNNRQPIAQTTRLSQVTLMGSLKYSLTDRGRQISSFAWVPTRAVPYVGGGGGVLWYRLRQSGDFVDALDPRMAIFSDVFQSEGWAPAVNAFGGVDIRLTRTIYATIDVRYLWSSAKMGSQFVSFDKLDLAGLRTTAGVNFLF